MKILKLFLVIIIGISIVITLSACTNNEMQAAKKVIAQEELDDNWQKFYDGNKEAIDKLVKNQVTEIAWKVIAKIKLSEQEEEIYNSNTKLFGTKIGEETKRLQQSNKVAYRRINDEVGIFDISDEACEKFGFHAGDRIKTPFEDSNATVIGVRDEHFWFHRDDRDGATFWSDINENFKLIKSAHQVAQKAKGYDIENQSSIDAYFDEGGKDETLTDLAKTDGVYSLKKKIPPIPEIE